MIFYFPYSFLREIRIGKGYEYPLCCVLHFSWDKAKRRPPAIYRGGIRPRGTDRVYVPCFFHMRRHPLRKSFFDHEPGDQLRLFKTGPEDIQNRKRRQRELGHEYRDGGTVQTRRAHEA